MQKISNACITWDQEGNPISKTFEERYFSKAGGLKESQHVFLKGNELEEKWQNKEHFVIAECGFGIGLNFFATLELFFACKKSPKNLFFISIENEPLTLKDLQKAHEKYPQFYPFFQKLYENYPPLQSGFHCIEIANNVKLLLCFYDVKKALSELNAQVDAWYLDGFSPAKNSSMWSKEVFELISSLSKCGTTLATYSVARVVKDGLCSCGFEVVKHQGFGTKKHMLKAVCKTPAKSNHKPWFRPPRPLLKNDKKAIIIGAGIAGASIAYTLACNGWNVEVIEKKDNAGMGASGNHCGVMAPLITKPDVTLGKIYMASFLQAIKFYENILENEGKFSGVKHYAYEKKLEIRWQMWKEIKSELFELKEDKYGKYFQIHKGAYVQPYKICQKLLNHPNIKFHSNQEVLNFSYQASLWKVKTRAKNFESPVLILATGVDTTSLLPNHSFALQSVRGQTTLLPPTKNNSMPLCHKGYICPTMENKQVIGATYIRGDGCTTVRESDNQENLKNIQNFLPKNTTFDQNKLEGRVSFRLSTNDRFAIIGGVHDEDFYKKEYKSLPWTKNNPLAHKKAHYLPNLYISTAHGSRGLTTAILGANIVFSLLEGLPLPLENSLLQELHSARFSIRKISRQEVW